MNDRQEPDTVLAKELALYAMNDYTIYKQRIEPWETLLARYIFKNQFDRERAIKGIADNLAKDVQKAYWKDYSTGIPPEMNMATKMAFATELLDEMLPAAHDIAREVREGKRDRWGHRKL